MALPPLGTLALIILCTIGRSLGSCPNATVTSMCTCLAANRQPFRYHLYCNGKKTPTATITNVARLARSEGIAGNLTILSFNGPLVDVVDVLKTDTFEGFTALEELHIIFSPLRYLEPGAFNHLPHLLILNLGSNRELTWLSGDPFTELRSLNKLILEGSGIKHLRQNMKPFFSSITTEIELKQLPLKCDCHLEWLYDFIKYHSNNNTVKDATCDNGIELKNVDNFTECLDVCELGYNPCHVNATCIPLGAGNQSTCSCDPGFVGDGVVCEPCTCSVENMVCRGEDNQCHCRAGFSLSDRGDSCDRKVSQVFLDLQDKCSDVGSVNRATVDQCAQELSYAATHNLSLPEDISTTVSLLQTLVQALVKDEAHSPSLMTSQNLVEIASQLLNESNHDLWRDNDSADSATDVVTVFSTMNSLGIVLLTQTNITNITTDNIALVLVRPMCEDEQSLPTFNGHDISSDLLEKPPPSGSSSTLSLPTSLFSDVFANGSVASCSDVGVVSLVYGGTGPLLSLNEDQLEASIGCSENTTSESDEICSWYEGSTAESCPTEWQVNSVIISVTVVNDSEVVSSQLSSPILISLAHENLTLTTPVCAFIDETQPLQSGDGWLTENCERDAGASSDSVTVCQCYHLTSFALVMSPSSSPPPENRPLHIATKVGLSLSILCLLCTVILLYGLKLKNKILHRVHRQLAIALGLAQLVFLVGVDRSSVPSPDQLCTAWAALLHYLLLATFLWQLCEGVHLYLHIGKVFGSFEKWETLYYCVAWGLPLVFVGPTLGLRFCDYGSANYCWITPDRGANWAFHGPVIAVLLINMGVLIYVLNVILRLTKRKEDDVCLFITLFHASLVLVPILGVTWVLGFFVVAGGVYATVVEWLFFVFTTLQGVAIFLAHCVLNREVRSSFLRAVGCRRAANNQLSVVAVGRRLSTTTGTAHLLRRNTSQLSGSISVGGFTPALTPSRRESETENPYTLNDLAPIKEEIEQ